jgi:hypothetical protein
MRDFLQGQGNPEIGAEGYIKTPIFVFWARDFLNEYGRTRILAFGVLSSTSKSRNPRRTQLIEKIAVQKAKIL